MDTNFNKILKKKKEEEVRLYCQGPGRLLRDSVRLIFLYRSEEFYQITPKFLLLCNSRLISNYAFPKFYTPTMKNYLYFSNMFYIFFLFLLFFMLITLSGRISPHFFLDFKQNPIYLFQDFILVPYNYPIPQESTFLFSMFQSTL